MKSIKELFINRPHVVFLGAGATIDAFPNGDKFGKKSALMNDLIHTLDLKHLLSTIDLKTKSENIEDIYSELYERGEECCGIRKTLEEKIRNHFYSMEIPDYITKYDLLLLSLTKKDCIASFNWDPLLIQAYDRVCMITDNLPEVLFLHGNVFAGICDNCKQFGPIINQCHICHNKFNDVPLLYPVKNKNYSSSLFIADSWNCFRSYLSKAALVTIYGYSCPTTDADASQIMIETFTRFNNIHRYDYIEIIEKKGFEESNLSPTWSKFKEETNNNFKLLDNIYNSLLFKSPRRSVEIYYKRNFEGWWGSNIISFSQNSSFDFNTIDKYLQPLLENEQNNDYSII